MHTQAWEVYSQGRWIDTVFYDAKFEAAWIISQLIDHDGYPCDITVKAR